MTAVPPGVAAGIARFDRVDVVVNNAGYAMFESVEKTSTDHFRTRVETNEPPVRLPLGDDAVDLIRATTH